MNATQSLIAAIALTAAAAGSAMAQEATQWSSAIQGQANRAEVATQARQAVAQGQLHELYAIQPARTMVSGLSREAVRAEARAALASGEIARLNARTSDAVPMQAQSVRISALGR